MNKLYIAFLWHMHQPMYKDPISGEYTMPWVRLHSTKGYNDMLSILADFPEIRQTFNFVPSLMVQIQDYASGEATDIFYELSKKPADELTVDERVFILRNFFAANWDTMVFIYPRYRELLEKRGRRIAAGELEERQLTFSNTDMRDLQVWFNLTWFGYAARDKDRELQQLYLKKRDYSEDDKLLVLERQRQIIGSLLHQYKSAQESGQIEVSVSPFYHPILPLLCDSTVAREARPDMTLPGEGFKHPEDARHQVVSAVSYYERVFGRRPRGMWPSEGSVSDESVRIMAEAGIEWIATDEEILLNTIKRRRRSELIYAPYRLKLDGITMNMVFRDKGLSDLIGFSYSKSEPHVSAQNMAGHLRNIHSALGPASGEHLVSIILDGENAWEYYPDGGRSFLSALYSILSQAREFEITTIGEHLERFPPKMNLKRVFSGSWINHDFGIWIGSREDNMGWDMLARTRKHLESQQEHRTDVPEDVWEKAWNEIYTAEGSDWFWWYGDIFNSDFDSEFDRLFRSHLMQVYRLLGENIPPYLMEPIVHAGATLPTDQPAGLLNPTLDGLVTHFYEWVAAGGFDVRKTGGAMNISETVISHIYWGFDLNNLFFRIDTGASPFAPEVQEVNITVCIDNRKHYRTEIVLPSSQGAKGRIRIQTSEGGDDWAEVANSDRIGVQKTIEFALTFEELGLKSGDTLHFHVRVYKEQLEIERWPRNGYIELSVPDADYEASMWCV